MNVTRVIGLLLLAGAVLAAACSSGGGGGGETTTEPPKSTSAPCSPQLTLDSSSLKIALGGTANVTLSNSSNCDAKFTITSDSTWVTAEPASGDLAASQKATVALTVHTDLLAAGEATYAAKVTAAVYNTSLDIAVTTERGGAPPEVKSVTGTCNGTNISSWTVVATDDVKVGSVVVSWNDATDNSVRSATLVPAVNGPAGTWSNPGINAHGGTNFKVLATDYGNHTTTLPFAKPATC